MLRLPGGRTTRRENTFRVLEWIGRQLSDFFDLGDWWSICTDSLSIVMIAVSIATADELSDHQFIQANEKQVTTNIFSKLYVPQYYNI